MKLLTLTPILFAAALAGCALVTPGPTPTGIPTVMQAAVATGEPTTTEALPAPPASPSDIPVPSDTPAPTARPTATPSSTPAVAARPVAPRPIGTATGFPYPAPQLLEPRPGDNRQAGKDDLVFKWKPVGELEDDECYQITVRITNMADPGRRFGEASYLPVSSCGSEPEDSPIEFVLYTQRHGQPYYQGLIEIADMAMPSNVYTVRWSVRVLRTDQTPLSPPSAAVEFTLFSP